MIVDAYFDQQAFPIRSNIDKKNVHFDKIHVNKIRGLYSPEKNAERSTTSHKACTVLMLFGFIQDYSELSRYHSTYVITIPHCFMTLQAYNDIFRAYFGAQI